jgi:hypothetical protein
MNTKFKLFSCIQPTQPTVELKVNKKNHFQRNSNAKLKQFLVTVLLHVCKWFFCQIFCMNSISFFIPKKKLLSFIAEIQDFSKKLTYLVFDLILVYRLRIGFKLNVFLNEH